MTSTLPPQTLRRAALCLALGCFVQAQGAQRTLRFSASSPAEAVVWQQQARTRLMELMMGGNTPARSELQPHRLRTLDVPGEAYRLEEWSLQVLPDRKAHVWLARPIAPKGKVGAVLAIHGHGGTGEQIVRGTSLYWYGRQFAQAGYVVIAPDVGQHTLQHTNWSLMGERTWDALRCVDFVAGLPEVDSDRLAVAGLSLGGETTMYVAALDPRLKAACSSGWLTTVANMKNGHCPCFDFPGLEEHFDFADIFACIAPRLLVCELGAQERAPGGFPVEIGRAALEEIRPAYAVFGATSNLVLTAHGGPHVYSGKDFSPRVEAVLGPPGTPRPHDAAAAAWLRFADGPESFEGLPYLWLGRGSIQLTLAAAPQPGDALELHWGSKGDPRQATLNVNGKVLVLEEGAHWGFRWVRVPLPEGLSGGSYKIDLAPAAGQAAFLSEVRLVRKEPLATPPDLTRTQHNATLNTPAADTPVEAFPVMRRQWDTPMAIPSDLAPQELRRAQAIAAEANARLANEAFYRCRKFVDGWLAHADPETGLIPRNLTQSRDFWNGRDSAADNYPFMVLTAAMTDRELFQGRLTGMLKTETRLTSRIDRLPDDYSFSRRGWRRETADLGEIIFDGAEYVKDGLLPITEWLGPSPWSERMTGIMDDIWKNAKIPTPFGDIPSRNFEVCGDLLQGCSRLYWFTGNGKYLDWAVRLGDFYLLGTNHPTRDLKQLRLIDHGCEVINGLSELYLALSHARPAKREQYRAPLHEVLDCILEKGRNADGLLYTWFNPQTGEHSADLCDTWGYDYDAFQTVWLVDGTEAYRDAIRKVLGNLKGKYVGACWGDKSADGFADSIEGALNLFNRERIPPAADWIDSQTRRMWAIQKPDGIIEGWHGDGNFARTSLMCALWKTQGVTIEPWSEDVRFGAVATEGGVCVYLCAGKPWTGAVRFDRPRHRLYMKLPVDYARINQFPEWFTADPERRYEVLGQEGGEKTVNGLELLKGFKLGLSPEKATLLEVRRK